MTSSSGFTDQLKQFDTFLTIQYESLLDDAISIFKHHEHVQDYLHDVIEYTRQRILRSGFTGTDFYRYVWSSLNGKYLTVKRIEKQKRKEYHYSYPSNNSDERELRSEVEEQLNFMEELNQDHLQYQQDLQYHTKMVIKFVEQRHAPAEASVFKEYFLEPKATYKKISKRIGLSITYCQKAITPIKKDLKQNYQQWLKNQK